MTFSKLINSVVVCTLAIGLTACSNGKDGAPGAPGQNGGKIVATMNCSGVISGLGGSSSVLNGLEVTYNAVLSSSGDVYSTASVNDDYGQFSGTAFYAAGQGGSATGQVDIVADFHSTADAGLWSISLNRATLVTTVVYDDLSLPAPVSLNFTSSACTQTYW